MPQLHHPHYIISHLFYDTHCHSHPYLMTTAEEGPWTETFCNPVKLMLYYKLHTLPVHHRHTAMNLYEIKYLHAYNILHDEQNGFHKKRSCQDYISSLYFLIENKKLANLDTYAGFVDFKKAFDSVPRELLWCKRIKIGIRGKLLKSPKALYTNLYSSVKVND